jgi:hypothetical protein
MWRRNRTPPPREPHPDPQIERQIQHVLALQRMVTSAESLIDDSQEAIARSRDSIDRTLYNMRCGYTSQRAGEGQIVIAERQVALTEESIREQRAIIKSLLLEVEQKTDGLSEFDRAYLDLSGGDH